MIEKKQQSALSITEQLGFAAMTKEEIIDKYRELKEKLAMVEKERDDYFLYLASLMKENNDLKAKLPCLDGTEYNANWSWVTKIVYTLKKTQKPLLSSEMIDLLVPYEEGLRSSSYRAQALSPHLGKAVKYKRVVAYKRGGERGNYYVLPDWIDEQGVLRKQYEDRIFFR